jgi:hypothetical protein
MLIQIIGAAINMHLMTLNALRIVYFSIQVLLPPGEKILRTVLNICEVDRHEGRHLLWRKLEGE